MRSRVTRSSMEIFPNIPVMLFQNSLREQLIGCKSVLDIGCGDNSPLSFIDLPYVEGFDGYRPAIKKALKRKTHDKITYGNVTKLSHSFKSKSFAKGIPLE